MALTAEGFFFNYLFRLSLQTPAERTRAANRLIREEFFLFASAHFGWNGAAAAERGGAAAADSSTYDAQY